MSHPQLLSSLWSPHEAYVVVFTCWIETAECCWGLDLVVSFDLAGYVLRQQCNCLGHQTCAWRLFPPLNFGVLVER